MSRHGVRMLFLTVIWVLLWGSLSVANVVSGVLISGILLVVFPTPGSTDRTRLGRPRPIALARLLGSIVWQLIVSNAVIAREIATRGSSVCTGIVAVPLRTDSEATITFLANVLSLTPGTMPVHVQTEPPLIYVHVLHLTTPDATRRQIAHLEDLTVRAFGSAEAIAALGRPAADRTGVRLS